MKFASTLNVSVVCFLVCVGCGNPAAERNERTAHDPAVQASGSEEVVSYKDEARQATAEEKQAALRDIPAAETLSMDELTQDIREAADLSLAAKKPSKAEKYVGNVFAKFLNRQPSPRETKRIVNELRTGDYTPDELKAGVYHSKEAKRVRAQNKKK